MDALQKSQDDTEKVKAEISAGNSQLEKVEADERLYLQRELEQLRKKEEQLRDEELLRLRPAGAFGNSPINTCLLP